MATQIPVGKARLFTFTVINPDGTVNTIAEALAFSGNGQLLRVTMNPSNNREFAAVGVANSSGVQVNAIVNANGLVAGVAIEVTPPPVNMSVVTIGPAGDVVDPPSWA